MDYNWLLRSLLLLTLIHLISTQNAKPPEIIEHPVETLVRKNEPATLNCKATGFPTPIIHWYVNGQKVKITGHRMQWPSGSLFFLQVQSGNGKNKESSDTGVYHCVATNDFGKVRSRNATLSVAYIHKDFRVAPKSVQANSGDTVHFQCSIKAVPEATIRWLKDAQPFIDSNGLFNQPFARSPQPSDEADSNSPLSDGERIKLLTGGTLRLLNVQPKDNGRYSCVAENFVDTRESPPALLLVFVKPFFTQKPKNVIVMVNEPIELVCAAEGDPSPSISWSRKETSKESRFIMDKDNTLRIENAQLSDQGTYVCEASNQAASAIAHVQVTVHSSPQLITKPEDVKAQQGSSVRLTCSAVGSPEPTLIYLRQLDFETIQMLNIAPSSLPDILNQLTNTHQRSILEQQNVLFAGHDYSRMHVDSEGNLLLESAKKDDEGLYVCCALNLLASTCSSAGLLILSLATPPLIYRGPISQTLREDSVALIRCEIAVGSPGTITIVNSLSASLQIQWLHNGSRVDLSSQRFLQLESGTLQIHGVQKNDSGIWTCIARNEYGEDSASDQLTILDANYQLESNLISESIEPNYLELPSSIYLLKASANELTIKWNVAKVKPIPLDSHLQVTGYQVSYFSATFADKKETIERNKPITWKKSALTSNTNITIDGLEPNSGYVFVVRCQTKYGLSVPSSQSEEFYTSSDTKTAITPFGQSMFEIEKMLSKIFKLRKQLSSIQIQLMRAKPVNSSTIRLIWQTNPQTALATINGYLIYYRQQSHSAHSSEHELKNFDLEPQSDHLVDPNSNLHSTLHAHHHNHHPTRTNHQQTSFKLAILNDSYLDSALITNLHPFTIYQFFIIAYHSPYLLSMPSNMAVGRTAEALPIRSPSRIFLKVFETTLPSFTNQPTDSDIEKADFLYSNSMFANSMENVDSTKFRRKIDPLAENYPIVKQKRLSVEISWSHVPELYWRGLQKGYRLDFQLIQAQSQNLYSRLNTGSFQLHVASNIPQLIHNPANHLHNNTITLNNLTIGASYLLRISACNSAGCGVNSSPVPLKVTPRFSYTLLDEHKQTPTTNDDYRAKDSLKKSSNDLNKNDNSNKENNEFDTIINEESPNKKDHQIVSSKTATGINYLNESVQTILVCSAAIFVFFLLTFLLLLAILCLCKNRKLNMKNKTMNINSYIAVAKENCDKFTGQSQQMRLLAPQANGNTLWSDCVRDSLHTISNTPISSNTSSARSRIGLPIPPIPNNSSNASQLLINGEFNTNKTNRSNFSMNSTNNNHHQLEESQVCNGYAELEAVDGRQIVNFASNGTNKNQFINQQQSINQTESTQPYATTTLMTFNTAFNVERELIHQDSSDQSIKLSIGTNLNSSINSHGSQQLQQHFQNNQFKSTNACLRPQAITNSNLSDSGSEVYGVSRTSLRKLNGNLESCSSIDSLTSNARLGQARQLIEKDTETGYYHQPYDQAGLQLKSKLNAFQSFKSSEIMRITTNSSQSTNNSPIQARNSSRFLLNNSFRTTSSFTGSQLSDDGHLKRQIADLGARQKSESNLNGNHKFSITCNPIEEFASSKNCQDVDNEYNTFDDQLESKMNKIKKYYQTTKSMNSDQLKSFLNTGQQQVNNGFNNQETQSLIYDLVSEEANS